MMEKNEQIGEILERLQAAGRLTEEQAEHTKAFLRAKPGAALPDALAAAGVGSELEAQELIGEVLDLAVIDLEDPQPERDALRLLPPQVARRRKCLPLFVLDDELGVAAANPLDPGLQDALRRAAGRTIFLVLAPPGQIQQALELFYPGAALARSAESVTRAAEGGAAGAEKWESLAARIKGGELPPMVLLVDRLIEDALIEGASDIHVEPEESRLAVRYRVDGVLRHVLDIPKSAEQGVISRIKIMAGMDIAQRLAPQDGKIRTKAAGRAIDLRVSTLPTVFGENVVLRILDPTALHTDLGSLGFFPEMLAEIQRLIHRPYGLILVTGPTGSGKTTTLYSALAALVSETVNIMSIEDPVEYRLAGVRQTQVNPAADLTFASALRSILRQDPDVVLVGEIRDAETAQICIQAAMTGHLVLSTLHTNDAPSALGRLVDMGVPAYLAASTVLGILAQRLARRPCRFCSTRGPMPKDVLQLMGLDDWPEDLEVARPVGCPQCRHSGYSGRLGIYELLIPDAEIRRTMVRGGDAQEVARLAREKGMTTLRDDGFRKVREGMTTPEEVARVCL